MRALPLALALLAAGCLPLFPDNRPPPPPPPALLDSEYEPETSLQPTPTTEEPVQIYKGDVKLLPPEARLIGTYAFKFRVSASPEAVKEAMAKAIGAKGGTHYLIARNIVDSQSTVERDQDREVARAFFEGMHGMGCSMQSPDQRNADCNRPMSNSPIYKVTTKRERVVVALVVAVRPKEWEDMPEQLRPRRLK